MFEMIRNREEDLKKKNFPQSNPRISRIRNLILRIYESLASIFLNAIVTLCESYVAGSTYDRLHHAYSYVTIEYLPPMNDQICSLLTCQRLTRSVCRISWCNFWRRTSMYIQIGQLSSRRRANILD